MYLRVTPTERIHISETIVDLQKQVQNAVIQKKLNDESIQYSSKQLFKPLIQATEQNTHVLRQIATGDSKISREVIQASSKNRKQLMDPLFQNKGEKSFFGPCQIEVTSENITVGETKFRKTDGLMNLIAYRNPLEGKDFTETDLKNYKDFLFKTGFLWDKRGYLKKISTKNGHFKKVFQAKIIADIRLSGKITKDSYYGKGFKRRKSKGKSNVTHKIFLPGNLSAKKRRLRLLLAEFQSGNIAGHEEICLILDDLKHNKQITKKRFAEINEFLYDNI